MKLEILHSRSAPEAGIPDSDAREFSFLNCIKRQIDPAFRGGNREAEISKAAIAARHDKAAVGGFMVPDEVLGLKRDLLTSGSAGNLVETDLLAGSFIGYLYNATPVLGLGATVLTGLRGNVAIPRQTGTVTAAWVGEGVDATESDPAFDQITLTPHTLAANVKMSRKALLQSTPAIEELVRRDLARSLGVALEKAIVNGSGTSNQPTGILNTTGIGSVVMTADSGNGGAPAWDDIVAFPAALAEANALHGELAFLGNARTAAKLQTTPRVSGYPTYIQTEPDKLGGYKFAQTQNVPHTLTTGTSSACSALLFGDWTSLVVAQWGGLELIADRFSYSTSGSVQITALLDVDIAVRHAASFAVATDVLTA